MLALLLSYMAVGLVFGLGLGIEHHVAARMRLGVLDSCLYALACVIVACLWPYAIHHDLRIAE